MHMVLGIFFFCHGTPPFFPVVSLTHSKQTNEKKKSKKKKTTPFSLPWKTTEVSKQQSLVCPRALWQVHALLSLKRQLALQSAVSCSRISQGWTSDLQHARDTTRTACWQDYELKAKQSQRLAWFWNFSSFWLHSWFFYWCPAAHFPGRCPAPRLAPGSSGAETARSG